VSTLVILGAADGSLSTYRTARRLGYRTICVDMKSSAPGVSLADEFFPISTREPDLIADALVGRSDLAGVLAPSTDIALPTLRALTEKLGLPAQVSEAAARASVDKRYFREVCDSLGLPSYQWVEGVAGADGLRFPVVVKPVDAQSGRGVMRCGSRAELSAAVAEASRFSYGGGVVVEEEILGLHCGCECIVDDCRVAFLALTERSLTPPPAALTLAHLVPASVPSGVEERVVSYVDRLCAALDYRRGPLNLDLVVDPDGVPRLIEMGARTSGNGLDELVRYGFGVDTIAASIQVAVGEPITLSLGEPRAVLWQVLSASRDGTLVGISGAEKALRLPEVVKLEVIVSPGSQVRAFRNVADKLGYAVLVGDDPDSLRATAERVRSMVRFSVV
jgi:biotin carboxylase